MAHSSADYRQMLFDAAPEQVTFIAVERREDVNGYWCYYTVAKDSEKPRDYEWRRGEMEYEAFAKTKGGKLFWDTQPRKFMFGWNSEPDEARLWVERQTGKRQGLEALMEHYGLELYGTSSEFNVLCSLTFGWKPSAGVFTLLPEEIEKMPELARDVLIKHLQKKGDG